MERRSTCRLLLCTDQPEAENGTQCAYITVVTKRDRGIVERLKRLQEELGEVYEETVDLRRAAEQPNHARNRWPAVERRAAERPPCHDTDNPNRHT